MKNLRYCISLLMIVVLFPFSAVMVAKEKQKQFTVVIDAGHGGKDIGAADNGAREKDINLGVALQLETLLKKKMKDIKVVMTRDDDTYLTLQQRADVANKNKGDLFISIHTNSVDKSNKNRKTVAGSSVYALGLHKDENNMKVARRENSVIELEKNYEQKYSGFDPSKDESYIIFEMAQKKNLSKSIRFAEDVQKGMVEKGRKNRGVHQAGFWVLWATSMPAVLIELDFICNPSSAKYMTSSKGQKDFADAIYNAVVKYKDSWEHSQGNAKISSGDETLEVITETKEKAVVEESSADVIAKVKSADKRRKTDSPAAVTSKSNYSTAKRRRRNNTAKEISNSRDVETVSIPLHTEKERAASLITIAPETTTTTLLTENETQVKEKSSKKKSKKEKKPKEKKEKKKRNANAHNAKVEKFVTVYKIQILASADLLRQNNPRFCGLSPISTYKENNLYKYYYGESTDKQEIEKMLKGVVTKIPDAFIVTATKSVSAAKN